MEENLPPEMELDVALEEPPQHQVEVEAADDPEEVSMFTADAICV